MRRIGLLSVLVAAAMALATGQAFAKELRVDDDGAQCPSATFTSVQAAVTAAGPKDTVKVCPGTYAEQVRIPAGKDGLKLEALKPWKAGSTQNSVLTYPTQTAQPRSIVEVTASQGVKINGFEITGPWVDPATPRCSPDPLDRHYGIRVDGGGDAEILNNHVTQIQDSVPAFFGCQDGVAIQVGRQFEGQTGTADIHDNVFDTYQKNGPTIDNAGSSAKIHNNTMDGGGPSPIIARNGVQVGRGAAADVSDNAIFGHSYIGAGPPPAGDVATDNDASGVIVFEVDGSVRVHDNDVFANDLGIDLSTATGIEFSNNKTHDNVFDGIRLFSDTSDNLIAENKSSNNGVHDCHDDSVGTGTAGTANTWKNDKGVTQQPAGICKS